jgi:hypothetical protein
MVLKNNLGVVKKIEFLCKRYIQIQTIIVNPAVGLKATQE